MITNTNGLDVLQCRALRLSLKAHKGLYTTHNNLMSPPEPISLGGERQGKGGSLYYLSFVLFVLNFGWKLEKR